MACCGFNGGRGNRFARGANAHISESRYGAPDLLELVRSWAPVHLSLPKLIEPLPPQEGDRSECPRAEEQ